MTGRETVMWKTDIHADDYALTFNTSKDMLDCMKAGKLDSISIVPNMSCLEQCMELLYQAIPELPFLPLMSVHLDFVEGSCLSDPRLVPLLADSKSRLMKLSWGALFGLSYLPWKRAEAKKQLKREIKEQIAKVQSKVDKCMEIAKAHSVPCAQRGLRIDSHQHAHMIPVVWEAIIESVEEEQYSLEYIRNSREALFPFLRKVSLWKTYRPINFVKNRLLSLYSHKVDRYQKQHNMERMYLWGLVMSGRMDLRRIRVLVPGVAAGAQKENRTLEILFHPGLTLPDELSAGLGDEAAKEFYLSENRHIEKEAVMHCKEIVSAL